MNKLFYTAVAAVIAIVVNATQAFAQEVQQKQLVTPPVKAFPPEMVVRLFPSNLGKPGHTVKIERKIFDGKSGVAIMTMSGRGQDRCELYGVESTIVYEGGRYKVTAKPEGNPRICTMILDFDESGEGSFVNGPYNGAVKPEKI